ARSIAVRQGRADGLLQTNPHYGARGARAPLQDDPHCGARGARAPSQDESALLCYSLPLL
ncbi:hypothetical protein, partial [Paenibacillus cisolokensis]|uniref:hypothetical protein n=1 Tax=Paenibacillus cisolokensis TaxID=1658519 RepID=UPI001BD0C11D